MVELEHTRSLLEQMGLHTAAQLLDAQLEQALHSQQTYVQFLHDLLTSEQQERQRKSQTMCPPQKCQSCPHGQSSRMAIKLSPPCIRMTLCSSRNSAS